MAYPGTPPSIKIIGIDPGSRYLGYGVVTKSGNVLKPIDFGTVKVNLKDETHDRLVTIYEEVRNIIRTHKPEHMAIEKMFFAKDATAAMKLGQARGVVLLAAAQEGLPIYEYSPNEVKLSVAGHGHADKDQIAKMVSLILGIKEFDRTDTSDALAIAICHLNSYLYKKRMGEHTPQL